MSYTWAPNGACYHTRKAMQAFFETYAGAHMEAARSRTEVLAEVIPLLQRVGCFARLTRGKRFGRIIG